LKVEILQRLKEYKKASMLLRKLLEQKHFCISRRFAALEVTCSASQKLCHLTAALSAALLHRGWSL